MTDPSSVWCRAATGGTVVPVRRFTIVYVCQMTRDSDIDLLIVEPKAANRHEESVKIRSAIGDVSFPVDVIVINKERFEATKDIFGGIAYPAHKYGRVIYAVA